MCLNLKKLRAMFHVKHSLYRRVSTEKEHPKLEPRVVVYIEKEEMPLHAWISSSVCGTTDWGTSLTVD